MNKIEINYQDTINKSEQLIDLAERMKGISVNDIGEINSTCDSVWKGDASRDYQKKLVQVQSKINKRAGNLDGTARALGASARRLKKLEEYARTIFNSR